jgi:hypothetical protein
VTTIGRHIDEIVRPMFAMLRQEGFRKRGQTAHRTCSAGIQVVNVQKSVSNRGSSGRFTVNLGVNHPELSALLQSCSTGPRPSTWECAIETRLGHTLPENPRDLWWTVDTRTDYAHVGREVERLVTSFGLPWLDRHLSLQACLDDGVTNKISRAAILVCLGREGDAEELMRTTLLQSTAGASGWLSFARRAGLEPEFKEVRAITRRMAKRAAEQGD